MNTYPIIYNINIFEAIWYILYELVKLNKINKNNIDKIFKYIDLNNRIYLYLPSYLPLHYLQIIQKHSLNPYL